MFDAQSLMNAANIINGDYSGLGKKKPQDQQQNQSGPLHGLIMSLFHPHQPGQLDPQSMQAMYGPSLMSYFGGQ